LAFMIKRLLCARVIFCMILSFMGFLSAPDARAAGNPWVMWWNNPGATCNGLYTGGSPFEAISKYWQCRSDYNNTINAQEGTGNSSSPLVNNCQISQPTTLQSNGNANCDLFFIINSSDGSSGIIPMGGASARQCAFNSEYRGPDPETGNLKCIVYGDRYFYKPDGSICIPCMLGLNPNPGVGDPIYPQTGSRRQDVGLGIEVGGQSVTLTYDTLGKVPEANGGQTWLVPPPASFGAMWQSNLHKSWVLQTPGNGDASYSSIALSRGSATVETAGVAGSDTCSTAGSGGATYAPTANPSEKIQFFADGSGGTLFDAAGMAEESYDATGVITSLARADGTTLSFGYSNKLLTSTTDQFGRQVQFAYEQPSDPTLSQRINLVTAPDGSSIRVGYDTNNNLTTLGWADNNVQTFVYENTSFPWAMTGIVDESGQRYGTYGYDSQGRANSTYIGAGVDKYGVTYSGSIAPMWSVTEVQVTPSFICREHHFQPPQNIQVTAPYTVTGMSAAIAGNVPVSMGQSQAAGSGSPASSTALTYDASGNVASFDNFAGYRSCFAYDDTRNLPLIVLEGLPGGSNGKACPASLASYAPSPANAAHPERKTTTVWHPDWVLRAQEAAPKKITTWVYNGQPDPIGGGTASCVSPATTLPDGKPLAVLCARYEQATTDATGGLGLSATVTGATRAWTYTYNQYGQVLTETTPKQSPTDALSHTTTYTYYPTTSFSGAVGHTMGDLNTIKNPLLQVTTFTSYDKAGRLLSSTDANLTVTSMTYWPRGWLHMQTVTPASGSPLTTTYDYWPTGLIKTVTMPDASMLNYAYDDAHRLTDITDAAGNKIHYVLDNVGNRTGEQVTDASGQLASAVTRVFDQLNRVQSTTGAMH